MYRTEHQGNMPTAYNTKKNKNVAVNHVPVRRELVAR